MDTVSEFFSVLRFYRRWYTAKAVAPLTALAGFRFSWTARAGQKWRHRLLRWFFNPSFANHFAGCRQHNCCVCDDEPVAVLRWCAE
jgi:hypothetical protein